MTDAKDAVFGYLVSGVCGMPSSDRRRFVFPAEKDSLVAEWERLGLTVSVIALVKATPKFCSCPEYERIYTPPGTCGYCGKPIEERPYKEDK